MNFKSVLKNIFIFHITILIKKLLEVQHNHVDVMNIKCYFAFVSCDN